MKRQLERSWKGPADKSGDVAKDSLYGEHRAIQAGGGSETGKGISESSRQKNVGSFPEVRGSNTEK